MRPLSRLIAAYARDLTARPLTLVDVGAGGGIPLRWVPAGPVLRVIGFEPDVGALADLRRRGAPVRQVVWLETALHEAPNSLELNVTRDPRQSSVLLPNTAFLGRFPDSDRFDVLQRRRVSVDTLDSQLDGCGVREVDFLKLDTQGTELAILHGATQTLRDSVFGLEVEAEFAPMYQGQPLFEDVAAFLRGLGFELFDIRPDYWKREIGVGCGGSKGQIIWGDTLWFKGAPEWVSQLAGCDDPDARWARLVKAVVVCCVYGYWDYALALCDEMAAVGLVPPGLLARLGQDVRRTSRNVARVPSFWGRARVQRIFRTLAKALTVTYRGWGLSAGELGNG